MTIADDDFAAAALEAGWIQPAALEAARRDVEALRAEGQPLSLAQALVKRRCITREQRKKLETRLRLAREKIPERFGAYRLLKKLGEGGMGSVFLAEDSKGQRVALKTLGKALAEDGEARSRFKREARAAIELQHPNIVRAFAVGEEEGLPYYAMEFCDGETIEDMLDRGGKMPMALSLNVALQVAQGLAFAHERGFVHRDIKPGNIFLLRDGHAKILDLGLSKNLKTKQSFHTMDGTALGTPNYISPEQAQGITDLDGRSDQYSLAATLYHMLTGVEPFDAPNPTVTMLGHVNGQLADLQEACPEAPPGLVTVMTRMLAKDPADRYPDLRAVIEEVERIKAGQAPATEPLDPQLSSLGREKARPQAVATFHPALHETASPGHGDSPFREKARHAERQKAPAIPWPWYLVAGGILLLVLAIIAWALGR